MDHGRSDDVEGFVGEEDAEEVIEIDPIEGDIADDIDDLQIVVEDDSDMADDEEEEEEDEEARIIEPPRDDSSVVFKGHTDEVFCIANNGTLVATGGKDDKCLVWSAENGDILFECTGHEESVVCVAFNHNGSYLATADLKGLVKVWDTKNGQEIWSFEASEIQWVKWHHKANLLLAGSDDGNIWLWNVPYDQTKTLPSHGPPCTCGSFFPDGKRVCAGYEDGSVKIWDLKTNSCLFTFAPSSKHHEASVVCIACHHDNNLFATGSLDGSIMIVNSSSGQLLNKYALSPRDSKKTEESDDDDDDADRIESLAFSNSNSSIPFLAIGCGSGKVIIWDLNSVKPRFQSCQHNGDVVKVAWHPTKSHLLLSCSVDGSVLVWDCRNGQQVASFYGHSRSILDFDIKSNGEEIMTASADFTARIYRTKL